MGGWKTVIPMSGFGATEDFACLMSRFRLGGLASYLQVGTDRAAGHHSDRFDFDETCLGRALELLARLAVRMAGGGQEDTETETESDMEFLDEVVRRKASTCSYGWRAKMGKASAGGEWSFSSLSTNSDR